MVLIESEEEILIKDEPKSSSSSSLHPETMAATKAKQVEGDDSDGFETASERGVSDEEGEGDDDTVTIQEPHQSDKPEKIEVMREGEALTDDGSNQEKAMAEANEAKPNLFPSVSLYRANDGSYGY